MKNWILAIRPKTLTASVAPILAATVLAFKLGYAVDFWTVGWCFVAAICIQIATNLINDAIDFDKGADTSERIGPTRVTASGIISRKMVMRWAGLMLLIALVCGIPLVVKGGWPIFSIGVLSLFLAYSYTGGPFPLAYLGLGDIFVILFFGVIAVGGVFFLLTGSYSTPALVLGLQIGLLSTVLIAINNLRDVNQDRLANKKTLAVRFGVQFARFEILGLLLGAFLLQFYWLKLGWLLAALPLFLIPLAAHIGLQIFKNDPSPIYNKFLGLSAILHLAFGMIFSLGLVLT